MFTMQVSLYFMTPLGCYSNIADTTTHHFMWRLHMKVTHGPEKYSFVLVNTLDDFLTLKY